MISWGPSLGEVLHSAGTISETQAESGRPPKPEHHPQWGSLAQSTWLGSSLATEARL